MNSDDGIPCMRFVFGHCGNVALPPAALEAILVWLLARLCTSVDRERPLNVSFLAGSGLLCRFMLL
jgi:hypothetical protein